MKQLPTRNNDVKAKATGLTITVAVILVLLVLTVLVFGAITQEIVFEKETTFDDNIYKSLTEIRHPAFTKVMVFFTFFGSRAFLLPAYLLIIVFELTRKRSKSSIGIAAVALCGAGILFLFKGIFKRSRPLEPLIEKATSFSYPSGHSFSAFTFSGIILYIIWQTKITKAWKWFWTVIFFLFAFTIAFSRVYLRVHFASDVVAGFCLSMLWLAISYFTLKNFGLIGGSK